MKELIKQLAAEQSEAVREYRHYMHMHPELSFQETGTQAYIKQKLTEFGIEIDKKKIVSEDIRQYGTYAFTVKLYSGIQAQMYVFVGE